ncbi:MAG: hypothetical protein M5U28_38250 [Sandaracinaceae bacterium]|nr:hypothetical protein [Sandaracinaceae bacterium]
MSPVQRDREAEGIVRGAVARLELGLLGPDERIDEQRVARALVLDAQAHPPSAHLEPRGHRRAGRVLDPQLRVARAHPARVRQQHGLALEPRREALHRELHHQGSFARRALRHLEQVLDPEQSVHPALHDPGAHQARLVAFHLDPRRRELF